MPREITIELPLPDKVIRPNGRTRNWRYRAAMIRDHRRLAELLARSAVNNSDTDLGLPWPRATLVARFATAARWDDDNAIGSLKAYRDGLADAGLVLSDADIVGTELVMAVVGRRGPTGVTLTIMEVIE